MTDAGVRARRSHAAHRSNDKPSESTITTSLDIFVRRLRSAMRWLQIKKPFPRSRQGVDEAVPSVANRRGSHRSDPRGRLLAQPALLALHPRRVGKVVKSSIALDKLVLNQSNPLSIIICDKTTPSTRSSNVSIRLFTMSSVTVPTLKLSTTGDAMPIVGTVGAVKTDYTE